MDVDVSDILQEDIQVKEKNNEGEYEKEEMKRNSGTKLKIKHKSEVTIIREGTPKKEENEVLSPCFHIERTQQGATEEAKRTRSLTLPERTSNKRKRRRNSQKEEITKTKGGEQTPRKETMTSPRKSEEISIEEREKMISPRRGRENGGSVHRRRSIGSVSSDLPPISRLSQADLYDLLHTFPSVEHEKINFEIFSRSMGILSSKTTPSLNSLLFTAFSFDPSAEINIEKYTQQMAIFITGTPREQSKLAFKMLEKEGIISREIFHYAIECAHSALLHLGYTISPLETQTIADKLFDLIDVKNTNAVKRRAYRLGMEENYHILQSLGLSSPPPHPNDTLKRMGKIIKIGSEKWGVMMNMLAGVRHSITSIPKYNSILLKHWGHNPSLPLFKEGNVGAMMKEIVGPMDSIGSESKTFVSFTPVIFHSLRSSFSLSDSSFLASFSPEQLIANMLMGRLTSLSSKETDGKSGSFFLSTFDGQFLFKTLYRREMATLQRILPTYFDYTLNNPNSLLNRICSFHRIGALPFVVLQNSFQTKLPIDEIFDLKGSEFGRSNPDDNGVKKDLDFGDRKLKIDPPMRELLLSQIFSDSSLLESLGLIDYSLLLGIHYPERHHPEKMCEFKTSTRIPFWREYYGGIPSSDHSEIYFVGIIDYLTSYGRRKSAETFLRSTILQQEKAKISTVPPNQYAQRFRDYISRIFG